MQISHKISCVRIQLLSHAFLWVQRGVFTRAHLSSSTFGQPVVVLKHVENLFRLKIPLDMYSYKRISHFVKLSQQIEWVWPFFFVPLGDSLLFWCWSLNMSSVLYWYGIDKWSEFKRNMIEGVHTPHICVGAHCARKGVKWQHYPFLNTWTIRCVNDNSIRLSAHSYHSRKWSFSRVN